MMKRDTLIVILLLVVVSVTKAQTFDTAKMDSLFTSIEEFNKGMGTISIFQDGKEVYNRSYGYADVENRIKANSGTRYRIGSVTKTFTATVIMKLVEEGKLSLSTTLANFFPDIENSDRITIRHLLQHRSGIFNFVSDKEYFDWSTRSHSKEQLLARIISGGVSFEPDEKFSYSNSNYLLLTYIAEDISGKTFSDLLNELIIVPCHLKNTYAGKAIDTNSGESYSYTKLSTGWEKLPETDMSIPLGAGYIVSNPHDLNLFFTDLFAGKIVKAESLDSMLSLKSNFGLGLFKMPFYEKIAYGHTGGIDGFQSQVAYFPESNTSIAVVENGVVYALNNIVLGSLSIYFGRDYQLPQFSHPIVLEPEQLNQYLGVYSSPEIPIKFEVTRKGSDLFIQGTGQPALSLECMSEDKFQNEGVGAVFEFTPGNNEMLLKQFGVVINFSRQPAE